MPSKATAHSRSSKKTGTSPIPSSLKSDALFDLWCSHQKTSHNKIQHVLLLEKNRERPNAIPIIAHRAQSHYLNPDVVSTALANLDYKKSSKLKRLYYPVDKKTRSGELGEILATEFVNAKLHFQVPILKLRWKDGRDLPMRGDDFIAIRSSGKSLTFIKGEAKSRSQMKSATLKEAVSALRRNRGRPSAHSLSFIATRLHEAGQSSLARIIFKHLADGKQSAKTHHLIFTFSENNPQGMITALQLTGGRWTAFVSLIVPKHQKLIKQVYKALHG